MIKHHNKFFFGCCILIPLVFIAGCDLLSGDSDDEIERTFPEAFDLELTTIEPASQ